MQPAGIHYLPFTVPCNAFIMLVKLSLRIVAFCPYIVISTLQIGRGRRWLEKGHKSKTLNLNKL